ncbi:MAG: PepSY-like domain-containing protein [Cyclobacteriaceae bacterium]
MKKQILIIGAVVGVLFTAQSQDLSVSQVPSLILNQFGIQLPKATDAEWEMEGYLFRVDFETGWNIDHGVWYDAEGKIVRHQEDISLAKLPKVVSERIRTDFDGYAINDLEQVAENDKIVYVMELNAVIRQDWEVVIDATGNVLSKVAD